MNNPLDLQAVFEHWCSMTKDDRTLSDYGLSTRTANCLRNECIETVGQLAQIGDHQFLDWPNFGRKSLNEVRQLLHDLGYAKARTTFEPTFRPDQIEAWRWALTAHNLRAQNKTLREVASIMGRSVERVRQLDMKVERRRRFGLGKACYAIERFAQAFSEK